MEPEGSLVFNGKCTVQNMDLIVAYFSRYFPFISHNVTGKPTEKFHSSYLNGPGILPLVLYACETWSLALREEHRLRVFENRVLRRIFGPKRDEVAGGWRKLRNEELHNLYSSPSIIGMIKSRSMGWAGHVAQMGEDICGKARR
jgi:hypothetical protein